MKSSKCGRYDLFYVQPSLVSRDWARPYEDNLRECKDATIINIRGVLPRSICGTYFRNGPGVFFKGGSDPFSRIRVAHPFDGDGAVLSIKFNSSDQAKFRIRFVQTAECVPCACHCDCEGQLSDTPLSSAQSIILNTAGMLQSSVASDGCHEELLERTSVGGSQRTCWMFLPGMQPTSL